MQLANLHNRQHFEVDDDEDKLTALRKTYLELQQLKKSDTFINTALRQEAADLLWPNAAPASHQIKLRIAKLPDDLWGLVARIWDGIRCERLVSPCFVP